MRRRKFCFTLTLALSIYNSRAVSAEIGQFVLIPERSAGGCEQQIGKVVKDKFPNGDIEVQLIDGRPFGNDKEPTLWRVKPEKVLNLSPCRKPKLCINQTFQVEGEPYDKFHDASFIFENGLAYEIRILPTGGSVGGIGALMATAPHCTSYASNKIRRWSLPDQCASSDDAVCIGQEYRPKKSGKSAIIKRFWSDGSVEVRRTPCVFCEIEFINLKDLEAGFEKKSSGSTAPSERTRTR